MKRLILFLLDDVLLLAGCGVILYFLSLWNTVIAGIVGGLMLIGLAYLVGRIKARG